MRLSEMRLAILALAALLAVAGCSAQHAGPRPQPHPHPQPRLSYGACSLLKGTSRTTQEIERCATRQ
jgi:hypothetical protein